MSITATTPENFLVEMLKSCNRSIIELKSKALGLALLLKYLKFDNENDQDDIISSLKLILLVNYFDIENIFPNTFSPIENLYKILDLPDIPAAVTPNMEALSRAGLTVINGRIPDLLVNFREDLESHLDVCRNISSLFFKPLFYITDINFYPVIEYENNCDLTDNVEDAASRINLDRNIFCTEFFNGDNFLSYPSAEYFSNLELDIRKGLDQSLEGLVGNHYIFVASILSRNTIENPPQPPTLKREFADVKEIIGSAVKELRNDGELTPEVSDIFNILNLEFEKESKKASYPTPSSKSVPISSVSLKDNYISDLLDATNEFIDERNALEVRFKNLVANNVSYKDGEYGYVTEDMNLFRRNLRKNIKDITKKYILTNQLLTQQFRELSLFQKERSSLEQLKAQLEKLSDINKPYSEMPESYKREMMEEVLLKLDIERTTDLETFIRTLPLVDEQPKALMEYVSLWVDKYLKIPKFRYPHYYSPESVMKEIVNSYIEKFMENPQNTLTELSLPKYKNLLTRMILTYIKNDYDIEFLNKNITIFSLTRKNEDLISHFRQILDDDYFTLEQKLRYEKIIEIMNGKHDIQVSELADEIRRIMNSKGETIQYNISRALALLKAIPRDEKNINIFRVLVHLITPVKSDLDFIVACFTQYFSTEQYVPREKKYLDIILRPLLNQAALEKYSAERLQSNFIDLMSGAVFDRDLAISFIEKINTKTITTSDISQLINASTVSKCSELLYNVSFFVSEENMLKLAAMIVDISKSIAVNSIHLSNRQNKESLPYFKINKYLSRKLFINKSVVACLTLFEDKFYEALISDMLTAALSHRMVKEDVRILARELLKELEKWRAVNTEMLARIIIDRLKDNTIAFFGDLISFISSSQNSSIIVRGKNLGIDIIAVLEGGFSMLNKFFIKLFFLDMIENISPNLKITPAEVQLYISLQRNPNFHVQNYESLIYYVIHITASSLQLDDKTYVREFVQKLLEDKNKST